MDFSEPEEKAKLDCIALVNELYGTDHNIFEEVDYFFSQIQNGMEAVSEIQKPEIFFLDEDLPLVPVKQCQAIIERTKIDLNFDNHSIIIQRVIDYPVSPSSMFALSFQFPTDIPGNLSCQALEELPEFRRHLQHFVQGPFQNGRKIF